MPELKKWWIGLLLNKNQGRIFSDDVVNTILQQMKNIKPLLLKTAVKSEELLPSRTNQ